MKRVHRSMHSLFTKTFYHENRYSIWRLMSLGAALMTAPWLQAQDVLVTLEAEKGIITLPAKVKPVDGSTVEGISGGKYVGDNDPGSSIVFNDIEVPEAGTYEFKTYYMSMQNRSIAVKVNNYSEYISTVSNTTPGWDVPPTNEMSTYIYMDKGKNTIKLLLWEAVALIWINSKSLQPT